MSSSGTQDVSKTVLRALTEAEMAQWWRERGRQVVLSHGRYWYKLRRGFYEPVHWLACLGAKEAVRPTWRCWGYRATLRDDAAEFANATMPVNLFADAHCYTMENLPAKRRTDLRKSQRLFEVVQLLDPQILRHEGYNVAHSSATRTGLLHRLNRDRYLASLEGLVCDRRRIALAGMVNGRLGGYLIGSAIEDVAYIDWVIIGTEYLPTAMGTGLVFEFVQITKRTPQIRRVVYGQHSIEDQALTVYKLGMLFPPTDIPSKLWMMPLVKTYLRRKRPNVYCRLTGMRPPVERVPAEEKVNRPASNDSAL